MSKLSVVLLGATLSLFATTSFAATSLSNQHLTIQHTQGGKLKKDVAKVTSKHVKKKAIRNAKRKVARSLAK